jgi:NAD(P)H dehydrogenase (quinone)
MRVHLVYAHPVETSFNAALRDQIASALSPRHEVDVLDLNAEGFDPVMSRAERLGYHDMPDNIVPVAGYVERLRAAQALVLCFPAWSFGPPAILKGWIDRVMLPGVSLHIQADGRVLGGLTHLHKLGGVVTYGQTRWRAQLMGDYPRKLVRRYLRHSAGMNKPVTFHAHYAMNVSTPESRARFLRQVGRAMADF